MIGVLVLISLIWSFHPVEMYQVRVMFLDSQNMVEFLRAFLTPDFVDVREYTAEMVKTLQIAIWGTFLAVVFGIPFAILSSANLTPVYIVQPIRRLMDIFRAVNELVFALVFVVAVGLGPFAGVMAIFVHNTGVIAKLFSEAIEAIDNGPVEGVRSTGANRIQEIFYGVFPQVVPLWSSYTLYRFESNVRSATILGIIGAGGIGHSLYENIRSFEYGKTSAIIIIIVFSVIVIDMISAQIRKWLV